MKISPYTHACYVYPSWMVKFFIEPIIRPLNIINKLLMVNHGYAREDVCQRQHLPPPRVTDHQVGLKAFSHQFQDGLCNCSPPEHFGLAIR